MKLLSLLIRTSNEDYRWETKNQIIFPFSQFYVCGFPNDNPQRVRRLAVGRTRFTIMTLTAHFTRIAVGDCRDGILFYSYHEVSNKSSFPVVDLFVFYYLSGFLASAEVRWRSIKITREEKHEILIEELRFFVWDCSKNHLLFASRIPESWSKFIVTLSRG